MSMNTALNILNSLSPKGIASDSRLVEPGYLFVALPSMTPSLSKDGSLHIKEAINRGAVAVLALPETVVDAKTPLLVDENPRLLLAHLAAQFYQHQPKVAVAVTGTNGKTSVASFTRQIWSKLGYHSASIGTLGLEANGLSKQSNLTTPDPLDLHRTLAELSSANYEYVAIEASSHGIDQYRLDGVRLTAAAFTNLTRDHLDYHETESQYFSAKKRLFKKLLPPEGTAVLNADSPYYHEMRDLCRQAGHIISSYGENSSDIRIDDLLPTQNGLRICVTISQRSYETHLPLVGSFQAYNVLSALGLVMGCGASIEEAFSVLSDLTGVRGRMQLIGRHPNGAAIYTDYAHTPDALKNSLCAIRPHINGRLCIVFGAGGDRDKQKRKMMGNVVEKFSDRARVTDDNPRFEDPKLIRRQILDGCPGASEFNNRTEAIKAAIHELKENDVLIISGKGHEHEQIIGYQSIPLDDAKIASDVIVNLGGDIN
jgi:UDP-N-acetylmuramoyl-L-alanyl-D-glutamate--2,6-diaminopimelate ligase